MNEALQNLEIKVENGGTTPQGRLTATEWNILVAAVKALDADSDDADVSDVLRIVKDAGYATQDWVNGELTNYATQSSLNALSLGILGKADQTYVENTFVKLAAAQSIAARHNFVDGLKIGDLPIYKIQDNTIYLDANLVVSGLATMFGKDSTTFPTIWANIPFNRDDFSWDGSQWNFVGSTGGGGGVADSVAWADVTGKPSWIGSTKPTYSYDEITGKPTTLSAFTNDSGFITASASISGNAATSNRLIEEVVTDLNNATVGRIFTMTSGYGSTDGNKPTTGWVTGLTLQFAQNGVYRRQLAYSDVDLYIREEQNGVWEKWRKILTSTNFYNYALPITGGTVTGNVRINKFLAVGAASSSTNTARAQIHLVSSGANPCDLYFGADDTLYWSVTARNAADAGGFNKAFALYDVTNSAYRLIVLPNGNIGIGTTSPETRLHVSGYAKITNDLYLGGVLRNANATWLLGEESSNGALAIGSATFAQDRYLNNLNGKLRLTAEGGVEAQLTYLDSNPALGNLDAKGVLRLTPTNGFGLYSWVRNTGDGYIQVGSDSRYATPKSFNLILQALGGNVGIGTASPTSKLHTVSSSGWGVTFDGGSKSKIVGAHADGFGMLVMSTTPTTSDSYIFRVWQGSLTGASGSGTAVLDVRSNGVVNIGGNLLLKGALTMNYSSDERLKKNIRKVNASEVLMSLGGVWQYEYIDSEVQKNNVYDGTHFGLIYQNVKGKSLDKMCHKREDGMGALNYVDADFISIIAGATMENISEVEKLKRKIRTLENKVKQLEQVA